MLKKCNYFVRLIYFKLKHCAQSWSSVWCYVLSEKSLIFVCNQSTSKLFSDTADTNMLLEYSAITLCVPHCRLPWSPGLVIYNTVQKLSLIFIPLVSEIERPNVGCHTIGKHQSLTLTPTPSCQWHRGNMTGKSERLFNACVPFAPFQKSLNGM